MKIVGEGRNWRAIELSDGTIVESRPEVYTFTLPVHRRSLERFPETLDAIHAILNKGMNDYFAEQGWEPASEIVNWYSENPVDAESSDPIVSGAYYIVACDRAYWPPVTDPGVASGS